MDEAIVIEEDDAIIEEKPLWKNEERIKYSHDDMFGMFTLDKEIDFSLFVDGYIEMFEVFNSKP